MQRSLPLPTPHHINGCLPYLYQQSIVLFSSCTQYSYHWYNSIILHCNKMKQNRTSNLYISKPPCRCLSVFPSVRLDLDNENPCLVGRDTRQQNVPQYVGLIINLHYYMMGTRKIVFSSATSNQTHTTSTRCTRNAHAMKPNRLADTYIHPVDV